MLLCGDLIVDASRKPQSDWMMTDVTVGLHTWSFAGNGQSITANEFWMMGAQQPGPRRNAHFPRLDNSEESMTSRSCRPQGPRWQKFVYICSAPFVNSATWSSGCALDQVIARFNNIGEWSALQMERSIHKVWYSCPSHEVTLWLFQFDSHITGNN